MQWIKYSERKPTEPGYYICKHYYKEVPEIIAGVDYMEFKDGVFWSEDAIYKLRWLDESSPPCQCERYREVLVQLMAEYKSTCLNEFNKSGMTWERALEIGMETYKKCEALLADGGKEGDGWIDVKKELPDKTEFDDATKWKLCATNFGAIILSLCYYDHVGEKWYGAINVHPEERVAYWMNLTEPLPPAPQTK